MGVQEAARFLQAHGMLPQVDRTVEFNIGIPSHARRRAKTSLLVLERAASSLPGRVTLHPKYSDLDTAAGIALVAHELLHQQQFETIQDFEVEYAAEDQRVRQHGLPPYENLFERPAYELEAEAYLAALDQGYPAGDYTPLLIQDGMASESFTHHLSSGLALGLGIGIAAGLLGLLRGNR